VEIDIKRRPFVVVDPRAGHGPGIGGFKADSEIGVAMKAGHPCYFIGFLPEPMPGQTIEDIARAEAVFIETVIGLHPDADGKPCVIGNCQAGWAVMMLASLRPELFGPLIIAGAPLSYWAGVRGKNPMRYSGGLLGGSWLTALTSDLGAGKFDGAWLVQNFENTNPANTLWTKQYNVYSKIDTEADRYLEFERWWGGHVNLNAEEIQFIVDELFVGNNLARLLISGKSLHRSSYSVQRVTTSRLRSRRSTGFSISTATSTRSGPTGKPSSTPFTKRSGISEYSSPAGLPRKSTANFQATST
jgi:pimeloyl-ACP methyl ester carboxylesterase